MRNATIEIRPLTTALGAEIFGVDIGQPMPETTLAEVRQAMLDHGVIFFRDQDLTPDQHKAFGRQFGAIIANPVYKHVEGHPEIMPVIKEAEDKNNIGDTWHSDMSFMEVPPLGSILYAREVPPFGGDTLWCNTYLAWERLSDGMKALLDGRRALHSDRFLTARIAERNKGRSTQLREDRAGQEISALHPIARTHDETGRKCLYVNFPFTWALEGMTREESLPILTQLYAHATQPEFCCRFRWQKGSVAFWDNRCTMHYACNDYHGTRREMHRITVAGTRPN